MNFFDKYMAMVIEDEMFQGTDKGQLNRAQQGNAKIFINPNKDEWNECVESGGMNIARGVATVNGDVIIVPGKYLPTHDLIINFLRDHMNELPEVDRPYLTNNDYIEIEQIGRTTRFKLGETFKSKFAQLDPSKKELELKRISTIINAVRNSNAPIKFQIDSSL